MTPARVPPPGVRVEHITMESDTIVVASEPIPTRRAALHRIRVASPFQRYFSELTILEGHFVGVRCRRPGRPPGNYEVDLRFANAEPVRVHRIPWRWLAAAVAVAMLGAGAIAWSWRSGPAVPDLIFVAGLLASVAGLLVLIETARRATTSLEIRSLHGDIPLAGTTAGLGQLRVDTAFLAELRRHTDAARLARPQARHAFLCDEMREHHRLRELGVLSDAEYEAGKRRVLAAHSAERAPAPGQAGGPAPATSSRG